jgi:cold-inducible RNA-binding protein
MVTKLFVGNLSRATTEEDLSALFSRVGTVASIEVVTVPDSNTPRHFAFIDMGSPHEAEKAIRLLNGSHLQGRPLKIDIAKPRERRPAGGGWYTDSVPRKNPRKGSSRHKSA